MRWQEARSGPGVRQADQAASTRTPRTWGAAGLADPPVHRGGVAALADVGVQAQVGDEVGESRSRCDAERSEAPLTRQPRAGQLADEDDGFVRRARPVASADEVS